MKKFFSILTILCATILLSAQTGTRSVRVGTCNISSGSGTPEGAVTGKVCDLYVRTDGGTATTLYVKESGTGNTGWSAAGAGGGGTGGTGALVLVEQLTASSSATLDFNTAITSTYDNYLIEFQNVVPATDNVGFLMRFSTDGGTSFDTGSNYKYANYLVNDTGSFSTNTVASSSATSFVLASSTIDNTSSAGGVNGYIRLFNPLNASQHKQFAGQTTALYNDTARYTAMTGGWYASTTAVNAIRFLMSSGNIASGTIRVYGLAKQTGVGSMGSTLIETETASSSASLVFTSCITSAHDEYLFEIVGLTPATDNAALWMRMSTDGGSSYDSATNYSNAAFSFHSSASAASGGGAAQTKIIINGGYTNTANYTLNGTIRLFSPGAATFKSVIGNSMARFSSADANRIQYLIHGQYDSTTAVNAVQFLNSTGNIASGTIRCYGIAK